MYVTAANVAELWPIVKKQNGLSNWKKFIFTFLKITF